jgi:tetratricopeptide (TPR) repeat protein
MKKDRAKPADKKAAPYDYDVFISYSSKDKEWVREELLTRIEKAGLRAFIDFRDFTRGAPSISEMERGVSICRKTLLILTPDYIKSGWAEIESIMLATLDPANRSLRTLPLLKKRCTSPKRIAALTHIDFTNRKNLGLAWLQLLTALGAAPEPVQPEAPSRDHWFLAHPYAMPPNFTGRVVDREMLTDWLTHDEAHPLLVLRALGGFGKSALTWHWLLNDVDPARWPRVVWWSFYEGDASFESLVAKTLRYLDPSSAPSASPREQLGSLLQALHSRGILLILDGFERSLRAFGGLNAAYQGDEAVGTGGGERDCLSPLADTFLRKVLGSPGIRAKVLLTTRLRPAPVETRDGFLLQGCREEKLLQLQPLDAVEFFHAQGIRGGRAEIEAACEPYGYHPLSLRLLAGLITGDLQQPGDIAAAQRLDVSGDLVQRQHHVLEQAYTSLRPARQKLLSRIACFRSPVSYDALQALAETESPDSYARPRGDQTARGGVLDTDLHDLIERGLLHRDLGTNRFDLHPIVRRYSYDHLTASDRIGAHARLRDYFAAIPGPERIRSLDDLAPVIELYHHTVRAEQYDEAYQLFNERLYNVTFYQLGAYQVAIDLLLALFAEGEQWPPHLKEEIDKAGALTSLANSYGMSGQPRAVTLFKRAIVILKSLGDKQDIGVALGNMATQQLVIGGLCAAEANLRRSVELRREIENDHYQKAIGRVKMGWVLAYRGAWAESENEIAVALDTFEKNDETQWLTVCWSCRAQLELLRWRSASVSKKMRPSIADLRSVLGSARRALQLAEEAAQADFPIERNYIRAYWLLGAAHWRLGEFEDAERALDEAFKRCRSINLLEIEADILIDLASLRIATAAPDEAQRLAEEALIITDRSGYVLQGADAHLVLAQLAKDRGDTNGLREHATEALRLATCDGPPDYTYKAAYDEATALLR